MGQFNRNTPNVLLDEWRPTSVRQFNLDSPNKGLLMRMVPGAITPGNVDLFVSKVIGSPGIAIELLGDTNAVGAAASPITTDFSDSIMVAQTTGSVTGWQNQAAAAATFNEVSDGSDATYHRNTAAVPVGSPITEYFAGLAAGGPSFSTRYSNISVTARVASTSVAAIIRLFVRIGGTNYYGPYQLLPVSSSAVMTNLTSSWTFNPATGIPWTFTDIDNFWNNVAQFGIEMQGPYASTIPAQTFRNAEIFMTHTEGTEPRFYTYYNASSIGSTGPKWFEKAVTSAPGGGGTYAANKWGWVHVYPWRKAGSSDYFAVPVLKMSTEQVASDPASTTGESRTVYETMLGPSGEILTMTPTVGEMFPMLIETTAPAIATISQPYADVPSQTLISGSPTNYGQTITTPNPLAAAYAGIMLAVAWQTRGVQPDAPLTIELRHGAGMLTGAGTLDATMTLNPTDLASPGALQDKLVKFPVALALAVSTQYFLRMFTSATSGKGWKVAVLDSRSDVVGTGITTANVEGATAGGTTDTLISAGVAVTRSGLGTALLAAPAGPASLTATPVVAA